MFIDTVSKEMAKCVQKLLTENILETDSDLIMHLDPTLFVMALDK